MTDQINIKTIEPSVEEVCLPQAKASGWIMFTRYPNTIHWMSAIPPFDPSFSRDTMCFPHPLFMSKEEAMEEARKRLPPGGDVKLFKVDL